MLCKILTAEVVMADDSYEALIIRRSTALGIT